MAIDPKELRLGSHVEYNDERCIVVGVADFGGVLRSGVALKCDDGVILNVDPNLIIPIPITPELLTELGFEEKKDTYFSDWYNGGFKLTNDTGRACPYWTYNSQIRIEHFHELETLYYMIYGIELINN